ncbi:single-stranded DNA-binding protein [Salmonella enterica]|uniref:ProQ/FINO family protein n=1 Tax=Salmonella enterica TaxID=28901 RepID=UPI000DECB12C|nr:ProQ/FINO family protein [Salmonella enterica]ECC9262054.1 single-stranded DNA-binding protein [Salmonella enterica subsp. diarizonae]ECW9808044.1 single-stranded DNA-binding protein [Salmonella enterica subsp. enterica serovar Poona]AXD08084.1 single-stranded DNA-binding protein [Salmonella enterica]EAQ6246901.1 single-stranded DNA-binding protein [Salmonella enterica]EAU6879134.1 single-stranded DNA-binding protein [Salmonella enterica]
MTAQIAAYGRLVADPQTKTTSKGTSMTMARMAVLLPCSASQDGQATLWPGVLAFGKQADTLAKHTKGDVVSIGGTMQVNQWIKVGVLDDIQRDIAARSLTIGAGVLKAAIASYTRRIRYKKALAAGGSRYDLNGQPCGEITPEQQQTAADDINKTKGDRGNGR